MIKNVNMFGMDDSVRASKFPMAVDTDDLNADITGTTERLGSSEIGSGHDQFLTGIIVQFDLTCSLKMWTEFQRYHFADFVSSQSTMHRICRFKVENQCNEYVTQTAIDNLNALITQYENDPSPENYLSVLYNVPSGFQLTARITTNYRQLKTMYSQRKNHRLPEWREFCRWVESLPNFKRLCL